MGRSSSTQSTAQQQQQFRNDEYVEPVQPGLRSLYPDNGVVGVMGAVPVEDVEDMATEVVENMAQLQESIGQITGDRVRTAMREQVRQMQEGLGNLASGRQPLGALGLGGSMSPMDSGMYATDLEAFDRRRGGRGGRMRRAEDDFELGRRYEGVGLQQKAEVLRRQLNLPANEPIAQIMETAALELGVDLFELSMRHGELSLMQKADACLKALNGRPRRLMEDEDD